MPGPDDILGMSDDDFGNQLPPEIVPGDTSGESQPEVVTEKEVDTSGSSDTGDQDTAVVGDEAPKELPDEEVEKETPAEAAARTDGEEDEVKPKAEAEPAPKEEPKVEPKDGEKPPAEKVVEPPNYEEFFTKVMTPFKANGKMIELKTPEEAIQLMQMGANYTRKMQDIVPHRKALLMLEKADLLDESKLSFLIDLQNKNPEAIRKLVKDSGLDVHDIDTSAEPNYQAGTHQISDEEASFRTALSDLKSLDTGKDTINLIDRDWDATSKEVLWKTPNLMGIIHEQRESGVYDRIAAEVSRQRTLGKVAADTPFINAYNTVGNEMVAAKAFDDLVAPKAPAQPEKPAAPAPVATRVAAPKPAVANSDRATSASTTRTTPAKTKEIINPLNMSDADFEKIAQARV